MSWSYWDIFQTSFLGNLALPFFIETHYYAALAFGAGSPLLLFLTGFMAATLADLLHAAVGYSLIRINTVREEPAFLAFSRNVGRWGIVVLLLPGMAFHGLLVVFFGMLGVHPRRVFLFAAAGQGLRYLLTTFITHESGITSYFLLHALT